MVFVLTLDNSFWSTMMMRPFGVEYFKEFEVNDIRG